MDVSLVFVLLLFLFTLLELAHGVAVCRCVLLRVCCLERRGYYQHSVQAVSSVQSRQRKICRRDSYSSTQTNELTALSVE